MFGVTGFQNIQNSVVTPNLRLKEKSILCEDLDNGCSTTGSTQDSS